MNNTASGLFVAITLLLTHMFLEAKTTKLIDSLEIAAVKFLNSVVERRQDGTRATNRRRRRAAAPRTASRNSTARTAGARQWLSPRSRGA